MAGTELTTGKMQEVAKQLEEIITNYKKSVDKVYQIGQEIDNMWDGEASNKFGGTLGKDRESFDSMTNILTKYMDILTQDIGIYVKAEADAVNILTTNKIR